VAPEERNNAERTAPEQPVRLVEHDEAHAREGGGVRGAEDVVGEPALGAAERVTYGRIRSHTVIL
jgi:hypothetical protein